MYNWKRVWRQGLAPQMSRKALAVLRDALAADDARLLTDFTTSPLPDTDEHDNDVPTVCVRACPLAFCGWQGEGLTYVEDVEEFFSRLAQAADGLTGEPHCVRHFTRFVDDWPRDRWVPLLLAEVERSLSLLPG